MTKVLAVIAGGVTAVLWLSGCSHTALRQFDCEAVLGLRLGQGADEVRALLGKPATEAVEQHLWESKPVVDYVMHFDDRKAAWIAGSSDVFWVGFFDNKLVRATAFRADSSDAYAENVALALGSESFGQPSPRHNNQPAPVEARLGPAFNKIFQCSPQVNLAEAQRAFEGQVAR